MGWAGLSQLVRYDVHEGNDATLLRLAGELDVASPQVVQLIEQAGSQCARVVLDMSQVSFLDASGLSLLVLADRRLRDRGAELVVRRPHRAVRRLLQLYGRDVALAIEEPALFLHPTPDVVAICSEAVEAAIGITGATTGHVRLADSTGALRWVAERNTPPGILDYFEVVDNTESANGAAWTTKNMVQVPDVTRSPIFLGTPSLEVVRDVGIRSVASTPLWGLDGQAVGTLSVGSDRAGAWSQEQRRALRVLASTTSRVVAEQAS